MRSIAVRNQQDDGNNAEGDIGSKCGPSEARLVHSVDLSYFIIIPQPPAADHQEDASEDAEVAADVDMPKRVWRIEERDKYRHDGRRPKAHKQQAPRLVTHQAFDSDAGMSLRCIRELPPRPCWLYLRSRRHIPEVPPVAAQRPHEEHDDDERTGNDC